MSDILYTVDYEVRRIPDQHTQDNELLPISVEYIPGEDTYVLVAIPADGGPVVAGLLLEEVIEAIETLLLTGQAAMPHDVNINFHVQEQLVNVEPWVRIGIVASTAKRPCSSVLWATTEEFRLLLNKLMTVA